MNAWVEIFCGFSLSFVELAWLKRQAGNFFGGHGTRPARWAGQYLFRLGMVAFFLVALLQRFKSSFLPFLVSFLIFHFLFRIWYGRKVHG